MELNGGYCQMSMHFLTEQFSLTHASELTIWIYKIPLQNQHDRHKAGYYTAYQLKGLNQNEVIVFNDSYIASFSQISNWASYEYVSEEHRPIQLQVHSERRLLERLIQLHLITHMKAKSSFVLNNRVFVDQKTVDQLFINKYIAFDTNVSEKGEIIIGFDSNISLFEGIIYNNICKRNKLLSLKHVSQTEDLNIVFI